MSDWDEPSRDSSMWIAAVVGLLLILLLGGGLFAYRHTSAMAESAERAHADALARQLQARQHRAEAETEREKSQALTRFLQELLAEPNPEQSGRDLTVADVLEAAEVEAAQPELDPAVREAIERVIRRARAKLGKKR